MSQSMNTTSAITKIIFFGAALGLTPAVASDASPSAETATPASSIDLPDTFGALDRNGNGVLSEDEGAQIETERWERMDSNGDGMVDRSEFDAVELDTSLTTK